MRHFAERMQMEASRLSHLVQDVIDLSRLQGDDPDPCGDRRRRRDRAARRRRGPDAGGRQDIELEVGEPCGAVVYGDGHQLSFAALRNLIVNAVAYSLAHTRVAVGTRSDGGIVEIAVKDQGIGIAANDLNRSVRALLPGGPRPPSRVTGGTGLGLAIVKHVSQNHGGELHGVVGGRRRVDLHHPAARLRAHAGVRL
ncbi:MAG: HAMP domain-containing sensor histidine kinase [Candidatus Nanopelagicales bacterium]